MADMDTNVTNIASKVEDDEDIDWGEDTAREGACLLALYCCLLSPFFLIPSSICTSIIFE
jgi:hypothetical protein